MPRPSSLVIENPPCPPRDDGGYTIAFTCGRPLFGAAEPEFVLDVDGTITFSRDDGARAANVGHFKGTVIQRARMLNARIDLLDEMDCHSQLLTDYFLALFNPRTRELRAGVDRLLGGVTELDVLTLDHMEILPQHRGGWLGLAAAQRFIDLFGGGCGIAILKPFPLQHDVSRNEDAAWMKRMGMRGLEPDVRRATRRLAEHWSRIGFRVLPRTPFLIRSLEVASCSLVGDARTYR